LVVELRELLIEKRIAWAKEMSKKVFILQISSMITKY